MSELQFEIRFMGKTVHNIDEKGRIFIPAKMREFLGVGFTLSKSFDKCLEIHSDVGWMDKISNAMRERSIDDMQLRRFIGSNAETVTFDKQGRIVVPQEFREYAGLKKEVVIIGVLSHAEIWDRETYYKYRPTAEDAKREQIALENKYNNNK